MTRNHYTLDTHYNKPIIIRNSSQTRTISQSQCTFREVFGVWKTKNPEQTGVLCNYWIGLYLFLYYISSSVCTAIVSMDEDLITVKTWFYVQSFICILPGQKKFLFDWSLHHSTHETTGKSIPETMIVIGQTVVRPEVNENSGVRNDIATFILFS